jgi:hypothetical protein
VGSRSPSSFGAPGKLGHLLLLRHPGLAQTGEIGGFVQGADLRHPVIYGGLQVGDARITAIGGEPLGFLSLGERSQESMSEVEPTRGPFNIAYSGFKQDPAVRRLCSGDGDAPQPAELAT